MRRTIGGYLAASVLLIALGGVAVVAGRIEHRIARAEEALAVLDYDAAEQAYAELDEYAAYGRIVPWLNRDLRRAGARRAAVRYWRGDYEALTALGGSDGAEADPEALFIAANAVYRLGQAQGADQKALLRALDDALEAYRTVLTRDGNRPDAAFNYEYVTLVRNELLKGQRRTLPGARGSEAVEPAPTVHGREGGPPPDRPDDDQKLFVPVDPDDGPDKSSTPGGDQIRQRKG